MTNRHDTPVHIARMLARFAPKPCTSVLDPSVGSGVLIEQFVLDDGCKRIECIDNDNSATSKLASIRRSKKIKIYTDDFLRWASPGGAGQRKRFDCIVMNPPFAGTRDRFVPISFPGLFEEMRVPIEAAFVAKSLRLLRNGGRLIAIVPASIISGLSTGWLRAQLMRSGDVRVVHELPNWTFSGIDGKIYILVYEHGQQQRLLSVRNHRLICPDVIRISRPQAVLLGRWDFGYVQARHWYDHLLEYGQCGWTTLSDACEVLRGRVESPITDSSVLHTTNFLGMKFSARKRKAHKADVKRGDLIMKRVGREAALSPIVFRGRAPVRASDCVLRMRPKAKVSPADLLFALRTVVSWRSGSSLIERGVGAKYVAMDDLRSLRIPVALGKVYPQLFAKYKALIVEERWDELAVIEERVRRALARRSPTRCSDS